MTVIAMLRIHCSISSASEKNNETEARTNTSRMPPSVNNFRIPSRGKAALSESLPLFPTDFSLTLA